MAQGPIAAPASLTHDLFIIQAWSGLIPIIIIHMKSTSLRCFAGLLSISMVSCQMLETRQAADSGFAPQDKKSETRAQFLQESWIDSKYQGTPIGKNFNAVYFAPVNTGYMAKQTWWQEQTPLRQKDMSDDVREVAASIRREFSSAVKSHPSRKLALASGPGAGTLVVELALVELVPSKAFWNAASSAAGFVVPGAGVLSTAGRGSIAIEGRVRNGADNSIIATFKDRRTDKVAPVNLSQYTWYHGAETNIRDWAAQFAELLNTSPDHVVQRSSRVTLKPW